MPTIYFHSLGCKVNQIESDSLASLFQSEGYTIASNPKKANVIVVGSCTVTAMGDSKLRATLRKYRRDNTTAILVLMGCYPQAFPEEAIALEEVDILLGTRELSKLPSFLHDFSLYGERQIHLYKHSVSEKFEHLPQGVNPHRTRGFLKIQDGCNRFCSYCIIPYARGRSRSANMQHILTQAQTLVDSGVRETVLSGINLACYRGEKGEHIGDVVQAIYALGMPRIRLGSLEPEGFSDDVLAQLSRCEGFCPQFHIALQSGSERILRAMHRHTTLADYFALVTRLRDCFGERVNFTTDMMVGFPDERDVDFADSLATAEAVGFSHIHVFRYSPRPGTPAADHPNQISENQKRIRADALNRLSDTLGYRFRLGLVGSVVEVLFERRRRPDCETGLSREGLRIEIMVDPDSPPLRGTCYLVKILMAPEERPILFGKILSKIP